MRFYMFIWEYWIDFLFGFLILGVLTIGIWFGILSISNPEKTTHSPRSVLSGQTHIVCLENHEYLYIGNNGHGGLALNVDDAGKPIKCTDPCEK